MNINKDIDLEEYLFRGLKYIEDMFNLPYMLNLNASEEAIKIDIIDPQLNRLIEVIPLDKDMVNKLFEELNLTELDRLLINTVLSRIEASEYDDLYYSPFQRIQRAFSSAWEEPKSENKETKTVVKSTFELQDGEVVYDGEIYPILQHMTEVKNTSNGYLFNRFYNRNQFFKWIKENSDEYSVDAANLGDASWVVVSSEQKYSSECWFIEVYTIDKVRDLDWTAELLDAGSAFFLADGKGNTYLINTNVD